MCEPLLIFVYRLYIYIQTFREVVVAQLVERSLPIPEVRGLNPVIGKIY